MIECLEFQATMPEKIRISGAKVYPSDRWEILMNYTLQYKRSPQFISIPHPRHVSIIRIDILSYYGNSKFNSITSFKVFGKSGKESYRDESLHAMSDKIDEEVALLSQVANTNAMLVSRFMRETREIETHKKEEAEVLNKNKVNYWKIIIINIIISTIVSFIVSLFVLKRFNSNSIHNNQTLSSKQQSIITSKGIYKNYYQQKNSVAMR